MLALTRFLFPRFSECAARFELEHVLPAASDEEIASLEQSLGVPLPTSYKQLLQCARGFQLMDGIVQFGEEHPFLHEFRSLSSLTPALQATVEAKGGNWPPPTDGMLCFAEFFMEADGDQVLFDIRHGLIDGEYPVVYYSHSTRPPHVRALASSFFDFMEQFLDYQAFTDVHEP
jgi:hypothetical protein